MARRLVPSFAILAALLAAAAPAWAEDRHAGYYYPEPAMQEVYHARAREPLPQADRAMRIAFVTAITNQAMSRPFAPTAAIFAKGDDAEKLIIVALEDGRIDTLYRARAIFANMTAASRVLPLFQDLGVVEDYTFFDLARLLGFVQITISDGRGFAHQVLLE